MTAPKWISIAISLGGTSLSYWLGGWDKAVIVLVAFLIADYVTGVSAAIVAKSLNSEVMYTGGLRKITILIVIGLCVMLDHLLGNSSPIFRTLALYFYTAREGLSVLENLGKIGVPYPPFIAGVLQQLQANGNQSNVSK